MRRGLILTLALLCSQAGAQVLFFEYHTASASPPDSTIGIDAFNRTDENPLANGTWRKWYSANQVKLLSNQAQYSTIQTDCFSAWITPTATDAEIKVRYISGSTGNDFGVCAHMDSASGNAYVYEYYANIVALFKIVAGSWGTYVAWTSYTIQANDTLKFRVTTISGGYRLTGYINSTQKVTYDDTVSPLAAGRVGVYSYEGIFDDFSAKNIAP
jgi:hypothetical protein